MVHHSSQRYGPIEDGMVIQRAPRGILNAASLDTNILATFVQPLDQNS